MRQSRTRNDKVLQRKRNIVIKNDVVQLVIYASPSPLPRFSYLIKLLINAAVQPAMNAPPPRRTSPELAPFCVHEMTAEKTVTPAVIGSPRSSNNRGEYLPY